MKITFFSNMLNHHQLPLCLAFYNRDDIDFKFVATEKIQNEQLNLGYEDMNQKYSFVIETYRDGGMEEALKRAEDSDIVIIGSAPDFYIKNRLTDNKLIFRYNERIFKKGLWTLVYPKKLINLLLNHTKYRKKNIYMLCASAYTKKDFSLVGAYPNKFFRWGYFPETPTFDDIDSIIESKMSFSILWVGRFIEWKHPELALLVAKKLKEKGYKFNLNMIGTGILEKKILEEIEKQKLTKYVHLLGAIPANEVQKYMEKTKIFIGTADYNEGWGATINEAMGNGCAVVASSSMGAVPFLIRHSFNGYIYKYADNERLCEEVEYLIKNEDECIRIGKNAYLTIRNYWNADIATSRLLHLAKNIVNGDNNKNNLYTDGPCSLIK